LPFPLPTHPLQTSPYDDESLIGFVFRLAKRRMVIGHAVFEQAGIQWPSNRLSLNELESLSKITGTPLADLQRISYGQSGSQWMWFRGRKLPSVLLGGWLASRRFCPACLSESAHHRPWWDLTIISICPVHRLKLLDTCETCGKKPTWRGAGVDRCMCGADLSMARFIGIDELSAMATGVMHGLLGDTRFSKHRGRIRSLLPIHDLDDGNAIDFLWRLSLVSYGAARTGIFSPDKPGEAALNAHLALVLAFNCLEPWPEAFGETLDRMAERWGAKLTRGAVRRWLDRLPAGQGNMIGAALDSYATRLRPS